MKNLIISNVDENINAARKIFDEIKLANSIIFYLNNNIIDDSKKYLLLDDFSKLNTPFHIYKKVRKFSKNWYKPIENELKYDGFSLGELIEMDLLKLWPTFLKIDILLDFIKKKKPSKIYIITEYDEDIKIIQEIIKNRKIDLDYKLLKKSDKVSLKNKIKDLNYKYIAKLQNLLFELYINKKNNILVIGNLRQTLNLLEELKKSRNNIIIRAGENVGRSLFTKHSHYYLTFKEINNKKFRLIKKDLLEKWNKIKNNKKFKNFLNYKINLFSILESRFENIFFNSFINLIKYIEIMKELKDKINIVVVHNDVLPFEKTIVKTANKLRIPTLTMIEGFLSIKKIKEGQVGDIYLPFSSKIMAAYSEEQKKFIMKKYKISSNRIVVTGHPMFDQYYNKKPIPKEEIYKRYNIPLNKKIILYTAELYNKNKFERPITSSFTQKQFEFIYEELFKTFKEFPETFLLIKKHPSGCLDDNIIHNIASKFEVNNYAIIDDLDNYNILNASYALLTRQSTMGLEAMMLKKSVIVIDIYFGTNDFVGYTQFNAALHARKPGELKKVLKNLLENLSLQEEIKLNMEKFLNYHYSINDDNASSKIANLINDTIKQKHL